MGLGMTEIGILLGIVLWFAVCRLIHQHQSK